MLESPVLRCNGPTKTASTARRFASYYYNAADEVAIVVPAGSAHEREVTTEGISQSGCTDRVRATINRTDLVQSPQETPHSVDLAAKRARCIHPVPNTIKSQRQSNRSEHVAARVHRECSKAYSTRQQGCITPRAHTADKPKYQAIF